MSRPIVIVARLLVAFDSTRIFTNGHILAQRRYGWDSRGQEKWKFLFHKVNKCWIRSPARAVETEEAGPRCWGRGFNQNSTLRGSGVSRQPRAAPFGGGWGRITSRQQITQQPGVKSMREKAVHVSTGRMKGEALSEDDAATNHGSNKSRTKEQRMVDNFLASLIASEQAT
ncbi:predicted protein [Histoplasma capsulatum var. duboisii H88]|uniref:Predicted protein n=1 Tax=Ajellomyces capsulatus (strain H88) TaxID=544711 RepID=F0U9C3_AJEC8|nr:predicted protein [Histoplasma capsulatum var. duboisii H88]